MPFTFPQDFNLITGTVEVVNNGNNFVIPCKMYQEDGITGVNELNRLPVDTTLSSENNPFLQRTTITWDGIKLTDSIEIPVSNKAILIAINNNQNQALTVTFENEVASGDWFKWYDGTGTEISFNCPDNSKIVYGAFQCFPKFNKGRIVFTANVAPVNSSTTWIQIQEI